MAGQAGALLIMQRGPSSRFALRLGGSSGFLMGKLGEHNRKNPEKTAFNVKNHGVPLSSAAGFRHGRPLTH